MALNNAPKAGGSAKIPITPEREGGWEFLRASKSHRDDDTSIVDKGGGIGLPLTRSACGRDDFRTAELFTDEPTAFKYCNSPAYKRNDVVDSILSALRNRCNTDKTLIMVAKFVKQFLRIYAK